MTPQTSPNAAKRTFLTDREFEGFFGDEVAEATRMLAQYATATCRVCGGECCPRISCEFYSDRFDTCPIYEYRPAKCRLYFCEKILENELLSDETRWLLSRPAKELSDRLKDGWGLGIFIEPPVIVAGRSWLAMLGIEEEVVRIVQSLNNDQVSPGEARAKLVQLVQRSRAQQVQPASTVKDGSTRLVNDG